MNIIILKSGNYQNGEMHIEAPLSANDRMQSEQNHAGIFIVRLFPEDGLLIGSGNYFPEDVLFEFESFNNALNFFNGIEFNRLPLIEDKPRKVGAVDSMPTRMSRDEAARYIGVEAQTLANWAHTGKERIPFLKVGRKVIYLKEDLDNYLSAAKKETTDRI